MRVLKTGFFLLSHQCSHNTYTPQWLSASHANGASFHALVCHKRQGEVEQEPLKTKQARNLKSATFTRMTQQTCALFCVTTGKQTCAIADVNSHLHVPVARRLIHRLKSENDGRVLISRT